MKDWLPPENWLSIHTIDAHTAGEPFRVILSGFPPLEGRSILEKRAFAEAHFESLRTAIMLEPRGHADMYGCLLTDPVTPDADLGVLFMHNAGYSTMCGHGIIALVKVLLETGHFPVSTPQTLLRIDTPAGLVTAIADTQTGTVGRVSFLNVPAFVEELDASIDVPGLGEVRYDLAFGGAYYAYVQADPLKLELNPEHTRELIQVGRSIKKAIRKERVIVHPFEKDLGFLYGVIFIGSPVNKDSHSRNVCIFADGEVDRSPTGTGVSGRLAIHFKRGEVGKGESIQIESILGTHFEGYVSETTSFGPYDAIIPRVSGQAYITGKHIFLVDPEDPLKDGFFLR